MVYFKMINSEGYLESISTGGGQIEITEEEYNTIMNVLVSHNEVPGKYYRLKADLTWDEFDEPETDPEEEPLTLAEALEALADAEYKLCLYELGMEDFINDL